MPYQYRNIIIIVRLEYSAEFRQDAPMSAKVVYIYQPDAAL